MFTINAECDGLSSAIYSNGILQSQLEILAKNITWYNFVLTWLIFAGLVTYYTTCIVQENQ